jgi:transcriptional regulator with XRE-family HTH domain
MAFGQWIRSEREQAGISLRDFAKSIDISQAYWSRIERGLELAPKDSLIIAACERLGLPTDRAFIEAQRLPPDMQADLAAAVSMYREFKARSRAA